MIDPHIKPKHDFTPATNKTALRSADALSIGVFNAAIIKTCDFKVAMDYKNRAFSLAVNGAALLQNFMNSIDKEKS